MTRIVDGAAGPGYEYGRLEIFDSGFWSNVCNNGRFTPDSARVARRLATTVAPLSALRSPLQGPSARYDCALHTVKRKWRDCHFPVDV